ncbi:MAG: hypothetical protein NVSMB6_03230 [Burkholderiaceae bacterium]
MNETATPSAAAETKVYMDLLHSLIPRVRREYFKHHYLKAARKVLETGPCKAGKLPFLLLSMVQKSDVISYLVAFKSFAWHANPQRVVIVCDHSIDDTDRAILLKHIPHAELRDAIEFAYERVPTGGTWERLVAISTYVTDHYVVQIDADTVTAGPIPEVVDAVCNGYGFVLGETAGQRAMSLAQTRELALGFDTHDNHVQDVAELKMAELGLPSSELYIRGCSGFTGFPKHNGMLSRMSNYSSQMARLVGPRWVTWGTEQVTSNYLVANLPGTQILPVPKYAAANLADCQTAFFHFLGYVRFVNSKYENTSRYVIRVFDTVNCR